MKRKHTKVYQKISRSGTKTNIDALAKRYIGASKLNMLQVGHKAKILPGIQKLGYAIVEPDVGGKHGEKKAF